MAGRTLMGVVSSHIFYSPCTGRFVRVFHNKIKPMGWLRDDGYIQIATEFGTVLAHIYAWYLVTGKWPDHEIDHKNTKKNDNRFINLRKATHAQNIYNRPLQKNNTSGVKGVSWMKNKQKWRAYVFKDYKQTHLGVYDDIEDAVTVVRLAQKEMHKEFVNFG